MTGLTPLLRRTVVEPLWGRTSGRAQHVEWQRLEASQYLSHDVLQDRQWRDLVRLVEWARQNNRFYAERLRRFVPLRRPEDFRRIPVLTKDEVRSQGAALLTDGFDRRRLMTARTGGSTGRPLQVWFTEEVSQKRGASGWRHKRWAGWEIGEVTGAVWGNPAFPQGARQTLRHWLLAPTIYLDTMSVSAESVRAFVADWHRSGATLLFGHAHSVFLLATMLRELQIDGFRPRAVITSSMTLLPSERRVIEEVLETKVTDMYGCEEVGLIASECEQHRGLHLNIDQLFIEVLREDGTPVSPGEPGVIVVTDLLNTAMPLIRYRLDDVAVPADEACRCGRTLPLLAAVSGRVADFLVRSDGTRVAGVSLIENTLTRIPGIEQMQIVQETLETILLRIVPSAHFASQHEAELIRYFAMTFPGVSVALEKVARISPEPNGKYRFSICRVPRIGA